MLLLILSDCSVFVDLGWKLFLQLEQQIVFEFPVDVDLSFSLFVLVQSLFDAIFCVQLRVSSLIDVIENRERNMNVFHFVAIFVDLLQVGYQSLDLLIENSLSLRLEVRYNDSNLKVYKNNQELNKYLSSFVFT